MSDLLSSPFVLVAVGLAILAVAIILLVVWIVTLDRRMRGVVDGLERERRKVAEMQMVIGRRSGNRGYGAPHAPARPGAQDPRARRSPQGQQAPGARREAPQAQQPRSDQPTPAQRREAEQARIRAQAAKRAQREDNAKPAAQPAQDQCARSGRKGAISVPFGEDKSRRSAPAPSQRAQAAAAAARGGFGAAGEALRHQSAGDNQALLAEARAHAADPAVRSHSADEDMKRAAERAARQQRIAARREAMKRAQREADRRSARTTAGEGRAPHAAAAAADKAQGATQGSPAEGMKK